MLFAAATDEIKEFANRLEELGGSILSTVDGVEVTVDHVTALDKEAMLKIDYATALDKFRRVSSLKKELERRPPVRRANQKASFAAQKRGNGSGAATAVAPALSPKYEPVAITPQALSLEEAKLQRVEESIRVFVRVADPKFRQIVPMRYFNLMLTPAEVEVYTADYLEQSSPRADAARILLRVVAVTARLTTEMEELKRSRNSPSVWKLHADSLVVLVDLARTLAEAVERLGVVTSQQAEAKSSNEDLHTSLKKLRDRTFEATKLIAES
jgi:hypothetical protein